MARIAIEMPKLGYDMETGAIGSWYIGPKGRYEILVIQRRR